MSKFFVTFVPLLHISWSEQKQISWDFSFSRVIVRHPLAVLIPISAARNNSSAEKHCRLERSDDSAFSFSFNRSRLSFPSRFISSKSTDFQHFPSQSTNVCSMKSNWAWQSVMIFKGNQNQWPGSHTVEKVSNILHWSADRFTFPTLYWRITRINLIENMAKTHWQ